MNKVTFMLAMRYLKGASRQKNISTMIFICFLGIFIGSFALALIASVMNGFEKVTQEKMQNIHSQIIMHSNGQRLNFPKMSDILKKEFPQIETFSPNTTKQVISKEEEDEDYSIIMLKGVDPKNEYKVSKIGEKIRKSLTKDKTLPTILAEKKVLIGEKLAENLQANPGDKINIFYSKTDEIKGRKIKLDQKEVVVGGIFKAGIDEFDAGLILGSLDLVNKIFPNSGVTQINVQLKPNSNETNVIKALKKRFKNRIKVQSWKELYPALLEALKLERYAMFLILVLITLVASMNIISLLFMQITQKRSDIAILRAMGMSYNKISRIFLYLGMGVSTAGSLLGLLFAFIAGWVLETYPFIKLPEAYYVTHLPSRMEFSIFVSVFLVVLLLSFLSTWIPARKTRSINISEVLRFEG